MGQMPHQSMVLKNTLYFRLETTSSTQFSQSASYAVLLLSKVETTELYYITGGGAPISLQSNLVPGAIVDNDGSGYEIVSVKLSSVKQVKHGGFSHLLKPELCARMMPLVPNPRGNYHWHWPTAILGFRQQFHPPVFEKSLKAQKLC